MGFATHPWPNGTTTTGTSFIDYPYVTTNSYVIEQAFQFFNRNFDNLCDRFDRFKEVLETNSEGKEIWKNFLRPKFIRDRVVFKSYAVEHHSWRSFGRGPLFRIAR